MNITDVRIRKVSDEGKMKAIVSITFDDEFVVHDVKIIEGQNGLFVAMPSRKWEKAISEILRTRYFLKHATKLKMRFSLNMKNY